MNSRSKGVPLGQRRGDATSRTSFGPSSITVRSASLMSGQQRSWFEAVSKNDRTTSEAERTISEEMRSRSEGVRRAVL
jgi:hypothetical protein